MNGRLLSIALVVVSALSLTACESNVERSAKLECLRLRRNAALKSGHAGHLAGAARAGSRLARACRPA